ncbi:hypothetical protein G7Y89_g12400 [Cudoniella acicularis]|uniref:Carboxymuconolactone decarboxylase-like domain-containing protein n=1 Tax=Cudoniella acicularis TaxID=354080 RepID=A0A8H4VZP6_9HELO|nr:hypothetical protein G7Y89_g12400 [Cudoniella acicularis]
MSSFEKVYVSANNKPNAPDFDANFINELARKLVESAPELKPICTAILVCELLPSRKETISLTRRKQASISIGAHRADLVPHLLEGDIVRAKENKDEVHKHFEHLRSVVMVVWPFVGIPWCVPACLGMINVLERYNLLSVAEKQTLEGLGPHHQQVGEVLLKRTYAGVQNSEVQDMLREYFPDFSSLTWTVVFGYCLSETTASGTFEERQTQLILSTAIAASGATRQARSHLKASLGLGNSARAVRAVWVAASDLNIWNGVDLVPIDIDGICESV